MESYIVRVYRRAAGNNRTSEDIVGYLETPLSGNRYAFHSVEELLGLMAQRLNGATVGKEDSGI